MQARKLAAVTLLLSAVCCAQSKFLDVWEGQVRGDQVAQFDALSRKIADANRKAKDKGDFWIAFQDYYGTPGRTYLVANRASLDEISDAESRYWAALKEYTGMTQEKASAEFARMVSDVHTQLSTRRWDLSYNIPKDPAEMVKLTASVRFLRLVILPVKQGRIPAVEKQLATLKEAMENATVKVPGFVSQTFAGSTGVVFRLAGFATTLGELENRPTARTVLGERGYEAFERAAAENFDSVEYRILRVVPEWSNPPKEVADADPAFWRPKPAAAPKPKPAEPPKTGT
jgi:hypothetical protein